MAIIHTPHNYVSLSAGMINLLNPIRRTWGTAGLNRVPVQTGIRYGDGQYSGENRDFFTNVYVHSTFWW